MISFKLTIFWRLQEDGAQGEQLARDLFHLQAMPAAYWHQELHPQGQPELLCALLWEAVCHALCALQEGSTSTATYNDIE